MVTFPLTTKALEVTRLQPKRKILQALSNAWTKVDIYKSTFTCNCFKACSAIYRYLGDFNGGFVQGLCLPVCWVEAHYPLFLCGIHPVLAVVTLVLIYLFNKCGTFVTVISDHSIPLLYLENLLLACCQSHTFTIFLHTPFSLEKLIFFFLVETRARPSKSSTNLDFGRNFE